MNSDMEVIKKRPFTTEQSWVNS